MGQDQVPLGQPRLGKYIIGINNQITVLNLFLQNLNLDVPYCQLSFRYKR